MFDSTCCKHRYAFGIKQGNGKPSDDVKNAETKASLDKLAVEANRLKSFDASVSIIDGFDKLNVDIENGTWLLACGC